MKTAYELARDRALSLETYVVLLKKVMNCMASICSCGKCLSCNEEDEAVAKLVEFEKENPLLKEG